MARNVWLKKHGIRKIPVEKRRKIKGYKKFDEQITFHHLVERSKGGRSTTENGALIKWYNHEWLHSLNDKDKEDVNQKIREYKVNFLATHYDATGQVIENKGQIEMQEDDTMIIPAYDCKEISDEVEDKIKKNKKKKLLLKLLINKQHREEKREMQRIKKEIEDR